MREMTLTACHYYYIQWNRMKGVKNIERLTKEEILIAQDRRACQLITDRLCELGIVKEEEKKAFFEEISTIPDAKEDK